MSGSPSLLAEGVVYLRLYYSTLDLGAFSAAVGLMLVAMMAPALQGPLSHLWEQARPYRRGPVILLFLAGYFGVWLVASALLLIAAQLLMSLAGSQWLAALLALAGGMGWQLSGVKARCLTHCDARVSATRSHLGVTFEPFAVGVIHGLWCAATCWPVMLVALCVPSAHLPVMIAGAIAIGYERRALKACHSQAGWADQAR
ncbi:copper chaperone [Pseudomonas putida]